MFGKTFSDVVDESRYILGRRVQAFEHAFAAYSQTQFCIGVGNGLDALTIALKSLKLSKGDQVIVPANTYFATWLAVSNSGLTVVPVDSDPSTFNLDAASVAGAITGKTRVILPVHLYGQPCDMTALSDLAQKHKLEVVEDNAQAHGATWNGRKTGAWGRVSATSFYPTKNLGALGDGGAITTSDSDVAHFARAYRNYGSSTKDLFEMRGINSRLDELQAALLNLKLEHLDTWNEERRRLAALYNDRLDGIAGVKIPFCAAGAKHVYHLYVIQCEKRDDLRTFLTNHQIETMVHYPVPPHKQEAYRELGIGHGQFPVTEKLAETVLSLPLWPGMGVDDVDYVCEKVAAFYR